MRVKTWKIIDRGDVPLDSRSTAELTCLKCGREAFIPVVGRPLAQTGEGIIFDNDADGVVPAIIRCRKCGNTLQHEAR